MRYSMSYSLLFFLLLFMVSTGQAVAPLPDGGNQAGTQAAAPKGGALHPAAMPVVEKITGIRWLVQNDAAVSDNRLRLVLDASGPAEATGEVVNMPSPTLVVDIKGAVPGGIAGFLNLDGRFASSMSITADGQNSRLTIPLLVMAQNSDCRIFTLPADANTNKPFRIVIDISEPAPAPCFSFTPGLYGKVIVVDPGHGGSDCGAIGPDQTAEKTVTLAVALKIQSLLEKAGAKVILTRQEDCDVFGPNAAADDELKSRIVVAENNEADIFLSIHTNAAPNPLSNGTATYFFKKTSYDGLLAQSIQRSIIQTGGLRNRGFFPANFYVLKRSSMPSALVELAFISNPNEEKRLNDPLFQQKMAEGIVAGLDRFFAEAAKRKWN